MAVDPEMEAWIDMELQNGVLLAKPMVRSQSPQKIRYEMSAKRTGTAGTSSTRQSGTQSVACCEDVSLSTLRLNLAADDACTLHLTVRVEDKIVAEVEEECKKP